MKKSNMKRKVFAVLLAGIMMASMAACNSNTDTNSNSNSNSNSNNQSSSVTNDNSNTETVNNYPGTADDAEMVTVDLRAEPKDINSILCQDAAGSDVLRLCMAGLMKLDGNDKPVPDLAEDYPTVSEDGKTYTFKIRQDAKWTNGEPVTANDFVFAYKTIMTKEVASVYGFIMYENILNGQEFYDGTVDESELGVKALDEYTLEVTFVNPLPYAEHLFSFSTYLPVNQKAYEEIGPDLYAKDADKIVTNGPYKITEWVHDDHITFEKNDDYVDAANIEVPKVKFLMMKDANARMNALKGGQIDCINLTGEQIEQLAKENQTTTSYFDNGNWYLQFNTTRKGLDNPKVRRALGMAIDNQALCDSVLKDGSVPATGLVPPTIAGANDKKYAEAVGTILQSDTAGAKALLEEGLAEAGMTVADLKLTYMTDDTSNAQKTAAYFQQEWKKNLGIEVEITPMPFKSRINAMNEGNFDIVMAGWAPDYNDAMTYLDMFMTTNPNNSGRYKSETYDQLIVEARQEVDPVARQEKLVQAEKLLVAEDTAVYPLYFSRVTYANSQKITGMTRSGFQEFDFADGAKIAK